MTLDKIKANEEQEMTANLLRLFKAAGCSPTVCHACQRRIKVGMQFKLIPHKKYDQGTMTDEMCCDRCAAPELVRRDKRASRLYAPPDVARLGGYSRPSMQADGIEKAKP